MLLDKIQILIRPPSNAAAQYSEIVRRSYSKTSQVSQPSETCKAMQSSSLQDQRTITTMHPPRPSSMCSLLYNILIVCTVLLLALSPQVVQCRSIPSSITTPAGSSMVQQEQGGGAQHSTRDTMDSQGLLGELAIIIIATACTVQCVCKGILYIGSFSKYAMNLQTNTTNCCLSWFAILLSSHAPSP